MSKQAWNLDFQSDNTRHEYQDFFKNHPDQRIYQAKFEREVKINPFSHKKPRRITKMKSKDYTDLYRWAENNTRVIYFPNKPDKTVYVIETSTATGISYKKRK